MACTPGSVVGVGSSGWLPNAPVQIDLHSPVVRLATVTADASGRFDTTVELPTETALGTHSLFAVGLAPDGSRRVLAATITVIDSDLRIENVPTTITADAAGPFGANVVYALPKGVDEDETAPVVACDHMPGTTFPIGTTTVTCSASDGDDTNSPVAVTFTVHVEGAAEQLADLAAAVRGVGPGTSLADKVTVIRADVAVNDKAHACADLNALSRELTAQSGKRLSSGQAATLIADARRIGAVLGC
jgi:hypothetical protein